jgi:putative exporter of polyketide antibiotics
LALIVLAAILALAAVLIGIDDNPPGAALAALSGTALATALVHHWRSPERFLLFSAVSLAAVVVLGGVAIVTDVAVTGNRLPASVTMVVESAGSTLALAIAFLGLPSILVGLVGAIVVWLIRRVR